MSFNEDIEFNIVSDKDISIKFYRKIVFLLLSFIVLSLFIIYYITNSSNNNDFIALKNWEYSQELNNPKNWGKIKEPRNPIDRKSNTILFRTNLPEKSFSEPTLFFYSIDQIFEVYLDNKLIYSFGDINNEKKFLGYPLFFISLEKYDYLNKELKVKVYSEHTNIGINGIIKIGEKKALLKKIIHDDIDKLITAIVFIALGIIALSVFFVTNKKDFLYINFALFSLMTGLYSVLHNSITRLITDNFLFLMYLELFILYTIPAFYNLFIKEISDKSKKIFLVLSSIFILYAIASIILSLSNKIQLMSTLAPFHILLAINCLGIFFYLVFKSIKGNKDATSLLIGNIILLLTIIYDIYNYIVSNQDQYLIYNIGTLILFLSIVNIILERYALVYSLVSTYYKDLQNQKEVQKQISEDRDIAIENAKLKADFLANMSHEIKVPINGVIDMVEILGSTKLDNNQKDLLEIAKISSKNLLEIMNNILDFSKIDSGKIELNIIDVNITILVEEVIISQSLEAYKKGLEIMYFIEPKVPEIIKTDPIRLKQVLTNLVSNAVKFTNEGYVFVSVKSYYEGEDLNISFSVKDTGVGISKGKTGKLFEAFSQEDNSNKKLGGSTLGLAISSKLVKLLGGNISIISQNKGAEFVFNIKTEANSSGQKMFNSDKNIMIFSHDNFVKDNLEKILLYTFKVCKNKETKFTEDISEYDLIIVDYIYYRKNKEAFTNEFKYNMDKIFFILLDLTQNIDDLPENCFKIIKPIKNNDFIKNILDVLEKNKSVADLKSAMDVSDNIEILSTKYKLNILVAEDNVINQKVLLKLLNKLGYEIDLARNGTDALNLVKKNNYDLIFMDIQMPDMNGFEATKKILELDKENYPKIIALTANATEHDKRECLDVGMSDYMSKPISIEKIENTIIKWGNILKNYKK
ncbi:MAG: response regulator [Candidatus Sericytochromatia bacterium]